MRLQQDLFSVTMGRASRRKRVGNQYTQWKPGPGGFYLVAFVDALGVQDALKEIASRPLEDKQSFDESMLDIRQAAAKIQKVRDRFIWFFDRVQRNRQTLSGLPPDAVKRFAMVRTLTTYRVGFSDSFVIAIPLMPAAQGRPNAAVAVMAALAAVGVMIVAAMAEAVPLRAGIDVERAINIYPNEVYGPALVSAYELESKTAKWPRAAVGPGLLEFLDSLEQRAAR